MFVTNDSELYEKVKTLSNHGRRSGQIKQFWPEEVGFKYKMSNVQAAIGCAQLERLAELVLRKREILTFYRNSFRDIEYIKMNPEQPGTVNGAWMPTVVFDEQSSISVAHMQDFLQKQGIDARVFFSPISSLPMFRPIRSNVNAYSIPSRALNLPSFHDISQKQLTQVTSAILSEVEKQYC
jgi:perosamine synthetase